MTEHFYVHHLTPTHCACRKTPDGYAYPQIIPRGNTALSYGGLCQAGIYHKLGFDGEDDPNMEARRLLTSSALAACSGCKSRAAAQSVTAHLPACIDDLASCSALPILPHVAACLAQLSSAMQLSKCVTRHTWYCSCLDVAHVLMTCESYNKTHLLASFCTCAMQTELRRKFTH